MIEEERLKFSLMTLHSLEAIDKERTCLQDPLHFKVLLLHKVLKKLDANSL